MNKKVLSTILLACLSFNLLSGGNSVYAESVDSQKEIENVYKTCKEEIYSTGEIRIDDVFTGYEYVMPVQPGTINYIKGSIGAIEETNDLWLIHEYSGTEPAMQGFKWTVDIDGEKGIYEISLPLGMGDQTVFACIKGEFNLDSYNESNEFLADDVSFEEGAFQKDGMIADTQELENTLSSYAGDVVPASIEMLKYWLDNNGLGYTLEDLGIGINEKANTISSNKTESNSTKNGTGSQSKIGNSNTNKGTRTCPNCNGTGMTKTYATNDPWEEPTYIECPMCHGTGKVTD